MSIREIFVALWESEQEPLSYSTLATLDRISRERDDEIATNVRLAKQGGPVPLVVESYRVIQTEVYEAEQKAKQEKNAAKVAQIRRAGA